MQDVLYNWVKGVWNKKNQAHGPSIRVGFVGCGRHARENLLPCFPYLNANLVGICALHEERAAEAAKLYGAENAFNTLEDMIANKNPEAIVACVNEEIHEVVIKCCIEKNIPVFVEKPPANSAFSIKQLATASMGTNIPVVVGFQRRYAPLYQKALSLVNKRRFGEIRHISFELKLGMLAPGVDPWWHIGCHGLDLLRMFAGDLMEASFHNSGHVFTFSAKNKNNADIKMIFSLSGGWLTGGERLLIIGDGGTIETRGYQDLLYQPHPHRLGPFNDEPLFGARPEQRFKPNETYSTPFNNTLYRLGYVGELAAFFEAVRNKNFLVSNHIQEALATFLLLDNR